MANNKDFKVKNGIKPTAYHEAVGTVTSGSVGYSLSNIADVSSFSVSSQESLPQGLFFKSDGTKAYVVGINSDTVYEYDLSTAWDLSTTSYNSVSFSVSSQEINPRGLYFSPDGTLMFIIGTSGDDVNKYSLSTAWDLSTASYDSVSSSLAGVVLNPNGLYFKDDGTKMYAAGSSEVVYQYSLSTAWDVSTLSYDSVSLNVASVMSQLEDALLFNSGTKLLVFGNNSADGNAIAEYSLSTAWDLSTATYVNSYKTANFSNGIHGAYYKSDGTRLYGVGQNAATIYEATTALSTKTLDQSTGSVFEITPTSDIKISLNNPAASGTVSAATLLLDGAFSASFDLAVASYDSVSFSVGSQDTSPRGIFFRADGLKLYMVGGTGDDVNEYTLTTAWDLSTASYLQNFSISAQETIPEGIFFKPDGTKMYIGGTAGVDINEYNLSTAWDISTASYLQNFSVSADEASPQDVFFRDDGIKMYIVGASGDEVNEYDLSTAWDISTASHLQNFSVSSEEAISRSLSFNSDGTKMFVLGDGGDDVNEYSLSTAWDISTASYVQNFSVSAQETTPFGMFFKPDGSKMYIVGQGNDTIYQYSTASTATITYDTSIEFAGGTAPTSPAVGDTDVLTFSTRDGGTSYQAALAIDGAS